MLIWINVIVLLTFLIVLLAVSSKNDFWVRFLGEMYHGIGVALVAGAVIGYFISFELTEFFAFFALGALSLVIGVMLVLTSEAFLVKTSSSTSKALLNAAESAY